MGEPLWGRPRPSNEVDDCDVDLMPQDISGRYAVSSFPVADLCSGSDAGTVPVAIELEIVVEPAEEIGKSIVYLEGSGLDWVDAVRVEGTVERQRIQGQEVRVSGDACPVTQQIDRFVLPERRRDRVYPRAVKLKMSKFVRKRRKTSHRSAK